MSINLNSLGAIAALMIVLPMPSKALLGQEHTASEQHVLVSGCYALEVARADRAAWTERIEDRVWLTTVQLATSNASCPLVMRPAPGELASPYALSYWILLPEDKVQLIWDSGMELVQAEFTTPAQFPTDGRLTLLSDALDAQPVEIGFRIRAIDCYNDQ